MSGPSNTATEYGKRAERLETLATIAALVVVIGLLIESGPELRDAAVKLVLPSREVQGNLLVTIAVGVEAILGWRALRWARKAELDAEERIAHTEQATADANERASKAEQAAAEANLARAKLEQRMRPRVVLGPDSEKLKQLLAVHAGKDVDIMRFDQHVQETGNLAWQFLSLFRSANWSVRVFEPAGTTRPIAGASLILAVGIDGPIELVELAAALTDHLNELEIECRAAPNAFGEVGEAWGLAGPFRLVTEDPRRIFGGKRVSAFRIQIGALQLVPAPPGKLLIGRVKAKPPKT